jgi:enoyl-CoA hydratase
MAFQTINVETRGHVGLITLNRPSAMNALSNELIGEVTQAIHRFENDEKVGALVITGSEKAFAAGADVKEMIDMDYVTAIKTDFVASWSEVAKTRKPIIAAVSGYALGGGCELAMMCDMVFATSSAKFGLPEITLGIIPGSGGTQRLIRAIGKAKAMDLVLTGRTMSAEEAERAGLVSRLVEQDDLLDEALKAAEKIAGYSLPAVLLAKESVNIALETPLSEGLLFERRAFHSLFATEDRKEGMNAFIEKRSAQFRDK